MTDQPPAQPPHEPGQGSPATQPMSAVASAPAAGSSPGTPPAAPKTNVWHQATSTHGGRWAIAVAAFALACLMLLGIGVAGLLVLRNHDRFSLLWQRQDRFSRDQNGRGPGVLGNQPRQRGMPGMPGTRGGLGQGLGGLGGLLGGTALHGNVSATVNGSVQALVFQRGQVTAVSATSITLKSSDGFVGTYGITSATSSMRSAPVQGGQAFVLARASDKVAITIMSTPVITGVAPSN
jgi:hypothetical protein